MYKTELTSRKFGFFLPISKVYPTKAKNENLQKLYKLSEKSK